MQETARHIVTYLSLIIELLAALVIVTGLFRFFRSYLPALFKRNQYQKNAWLRVEFGSTLTIALELLLAADILQTAVAPSWDEIGKLAAIAAIRTALNYFLEKELSGLEKRDLKHNLSE